MTQLTGQRRRCNRLLSATYTSGRCFTGKRGSMRFVHATKHVMPQPMFIMSVPFVAKREG